MEQTWSKLKTGFHSCRLSLCEKALAEYLETKRVTFPRFYFISSTDLLDILSKGTQPKQVMALLISSGMSQFLHHYQVPSVTLHVPRTRKSAFEFLNVAAEGNERG